MPFLIIANSALVQGIVRGQVVTSNLSDLFIVPVSLIAGIAHSFGVFLSLSVCTFYCLSLSFVFFLPFLGFVFFLPFLGSCLFSRTLLLVFPFNFHNVTILYFFLLMLTLLCFVFFLPFLGFVFFLSFIPYFVACFLS